VWLAFLSNKALSVFTGFSPRRGQRALAQISIKNVTILEPKILLWFV
jgi:hypothetical protein